MDIRDCKFADLDAVFRIENASFDEPYPMELFVALLKGFPPGFRVAVIEDRIVGYSVIYHSTWRKIMFLYSLATDPDFRNKGIGSSLLRDAIGIAKEYSVTFSIKKLVLQVAVENKSAQSLYAKFGFETGGNLRNYYGRGRHGIQMELVL